MHLCNKQLNFVYRVSKACLLHQDLELLPVLVDDLDRCLISGAFLEPVELDDILLREGLDHSTVLCECAFELMV